MFTVDKNGLIEDPGKFEFEPIEAVVLYDLAMCSCYDDVVVSNDRYFYLFCPSDDPIPEDFLEEIPSEWHKHVQEQLSKNWYILFVDDNGFVFTKCYTDEESFKNDVQMLKDEDHSDST